MIVLTNTSPIVKGGMSESLTVWTVVPFSRPAMRNRVLRNFHRQTYANKRLVIVENGDGVGSFVDEPYLYDHVILSQNHQSHAKNTAIDFLKKNHPDDYWCAMDDDDFYGPQYITEHSERAKHGRINGKRNAWVKFDSGLVYFGHHWKRYSAAKSFIGGTMGSYISDAQEFPVVVAGEEAGFCESARSKGMDTLTTSSSNFCYNRLGDPSSHTFQADEEKVWRQSGGTGIRVKGPWSTWVSGTPPVGNPVQFSSEVS